MNLPMKKKIRKEEKKTDVLTNLHLNIHVYSLWKKKRSYIQTQTQIYTCTHVGKCVDSETYVHTPEYLQLEKKVLEVRSDPSPSYAHET